MSPATESPAALDEELRNIVDHAEALLDALADDGDARLDTLRRRVSESIESARARLDAMASDANRASERAMAAVERWMRDNPWTVVAVGASIGLIVGVLLAGRRKRAAHAHPETQ